MPHQPLAIYLQDKHSIRDEFEFARYGEQCGFGAIWQADTRLARDCISMLGALAAITTRVKIGSSVLPIWPRNVATLAAPLYGRGGQHRHKATVVFLAELDIVMRLNPRCEKSYILYRDRSLT